MIDDGGQIHLFGKGSKILVFRVSSDTLALFEGLAAPKLRLMYSLVPAERDISNDKPSEKSAESGDEQQGSTSTCIN